MSNGKKQDSVVCLTIVRVCMAALHTPVTLCRQCQVQGQLLHVEPVTNCHSVRIVIFIRCIFMNFVLMIQITLFNFYRSDMPLALSINARN